MKSRNLTFNSLLLLNKTRFQEWNCVVEYSSIFKNHISRFINFSKKRNMNFRILTSVSILLFLNVSVQAQVNVDATASGNSSASFNLKNSNGKWHLSGPRSYETDNPFSIFWNDNTGYHRYFTVKSNGKIGIHSADPKSDFQIGPSWFFHNGDHKFISSNSYWNGAQGQSLRTVNGYSSSVFFRHNGGIALGVAGSNLAGTPVYMNYSFGLAADGKIYAGGNGASTLNHQFSVFGTTYLRDLVTIGESGDLATDYKLYVHGKIGSKAIKVDVNGVWGDYVFEEGYNLKPLEEVQDFINQKGHLPDVPSADQIESEGIDVAQMDQIQMVKIEELTLYLLEMKKENEALKKRIEALEATK